MSKKRAVFRVDGSAKIGLGHVIRCIALLEQLKGTFDCLFCIVEPEIETYNLIQNAGADCAVIPLLNKTEEIDFLGKNVLRDTDILIIDGYQFDFNYHKLLKSFCSLLISIDDLYNKQCADIVINTSNKAKPELYVSSNKSTVYCLGLKYALLRKEFLLRNSFIKKINTTKLLICFGGADKFNLTLKVLKSVVQIDTFNEINIVVGPEYKHISELEKFIFNSSKKIKYHVNITASQLKSEIELSDLMFCSTSGILIEAIAVGVGIVCGYYVENQKEINNFVKKEQLGISLEDLTMISEENIIEAVNNISIDFVNASISKQQQIIDGKSLIRLNKIILCEYFKKNISIRSANKDDVLKYFEWVNEAKVRLNSFKQELITYSDHSNWFNSKLIDENTFMYVVEFLGESIGQIRYDFDGDLYWIDYSIDVKYRGLGLAHFCLNLTNNLILIKSNIVRIRAEVKNTNIASIKVFERLKFKRMYISELSEYCIYDLEKNEK